MKNRVFRKNALETLADIIAPLIFTALVIVIIGVGLHQTEVSSRSEALRMLEDSIRRAAVKCYTVEGSYPESIEYIENNYGIHIDKTKYAVFYEIFASNFMPDITVIDLREP